MVEGIGQLQQDLLQEKEFKKYFKSKSEVKYQESEIRLNVILYYVIYL